MKPIILYIFIFLVLISMANAETIKDNPRELDWKIEYSGVEEEYMTVEYTKWDGITQFCIYFKDKSKYITELSKVGRNIADYPITKLAKENDFQVSFDKLSFSQSSHTYCFLVTYSTLSKDMSFKLGWESVTISADDSSLATAYSNSHNMIVDGNGVYHAIWEDSGSDLHYGNSSDGGNTWVTNEIFPGKTIIYSGITICPNGSMLSYYVDQGHSNQQLEGKWSYDGGISWNADFVISAPGGSDYQQNNCLCDSNNIVHCAAVGSGPMIYVNTSDSNEYTLNGSSMGYSVLQLDSNNNVYIAFSSSTNDDLHIMSSKNDWHVHEIIEGTAWTELNGIGFTIQDDVMHYMFSNGTWNVFANGSVDDISVVETEGVNQETYYNVQTIANNDTIVVGYGTNSGAAGAIGYLNKSIGGLWNSQVGLQLDPNGYHMSMTDAPFFNPTMANDLVHYVYNNVGSVAYANISINISAGEAPPGCTPNFVNTSSDWINITCLLNDTLNITRNIFQNDTNHCDGSTNTTFTEYTVNGTCDNCTPVATNTSWTPYVNVSQCYINGTLQQTRNRTEYDGNQCYSKTGLANDTFSNNTWFDSRAGNCTYVCVSAINLLCTINVTVGTLDFGNVSQTWSSNGDSFNVSEVVGVPGYEVYGNFTNWSSFNRLNIRGWYDGNVGHTVNVEIKNSTDWTVLGQITDDTDWSLMSFTVSDYTLYNISNVVQMRITHAVAGNINHDIYLDHIYLSTFTASANVTSNVTYIRPHVKLFPFVLLNRTEQLKLIPYVILGNHTVFT